MARCPATPIVGFWILGTTNSATVVPDTYDDGHLAIFGCRTHQPRRIRRPSLRLLPITPESTDVACPLTPPHLQGAGGTAGFTGSGLVSHASGAVHAWWPPWHFHNQPGRYRFPARPGCVFRLAGGPGSVGTGIGHRRPILGQKWS
jgi:hypothetical protein